MRKRGRGSRAEALLLSISVHLEKDALFRFVFFLAPAQALLGDGVRSDHRAAFCNKSVDVLHQRCALIGDCGVILKK